MKLRVLKKLQARNSEYSTRWPPPLAVMARLRREANRRPRTLQYRDLPFAKDPLLLIYDELVASGKIAEPPLGKTGIAKGARLLTPLI